MLCVTRALRVSFALMATHSVYIIRSRIYYAWPAAVCGWQYKTCTTYFTTWYHYNELDKFLVKSSVFDSICITRNPSFASGGAGRVVIRVALLLHTLCGCKFYAPDKVGSFCAQSGPLSACAWCVAYSAPYRWEKVLKLCWVVLLALRLCLCEKKKKFR